MTQQPAVGIDLGGTKIHAGVVAPDGRILGEARVPTQADTDTETVVGNILRAARGAAQDASLELGQVAGLGVGSPGPLDIFTGLVISPRNLHPLHGVNLVDRLSDALDVQVAINNDANCFGLAEARFGAGAGARTCCGFTLGTGLGCFAVLDGRLYCGPRGAAAEIWCSPYRGDQVEEKVSGRAVARNYRKLTERHADAAEVAGLARDGEEPAAEAWREFGRDFATPLAFVCNAFDPDVVVLGGSMVAAWDLFRDSLLVEALKYVNPVNRAAVRVEPAQLGPEAGMMGAAALVLAPPEADAP